jgi:hypothetical protein
MSVGLPTNCQDIQNHAPPHVFSRWHMRHAVRQRDGETGASTPYRVAVLLAAARGWPGLACMLRRRGRH